MRNDMEMAIEELGEEGAMAIGEEEEVVVTEGC
jgi:hypothetical protein